MKNIKVKANPTLEWHISDNSGILEIEPVGPDYANGNTDGHGICFHNEDDAIRQLISLIGVLRRRLYEKDPALCYRCKTPIPYGVTQDDPDWPCPKCGISNMGS